MNLLVTAGNTFVPIDRVRGITNVFTGRTGAAIALHAHEQGHAVTLLTSHPEAVSGLHAAADPPGERWTLCRYQTFEDLHRCMQDLLKGGRFDAVVHSAAVSDYLAAGIYAPVPGTRFRPEDGRWLGESPLPPTLVDRSAGKVKSDEAELWVRLVRAPKLIDLVRGTWQFRGLLVKFKLEVNVPDDRLLEIAEQSRLHSAADLMVANTLEAAGAHAFLGPLGGTYHRVARPDLASRLLDVLEQLYRERDHG